MGNISYTIDTKKNIIDAKCSGRIVLEELKAIADAVLLDPEFHKGLNSISDMREAHIAFSFLDALSFRNHIRTFEKIRGKYKWAIITGPQKTPNIYKLFEILSLDGFFKIKLFQNRNEAEIWISSNPQH